MGIDTATQYKLDHYRGLNPLEVGLGTLIKNAEDVVAGEIALADGKILIGGATGVSAAQTITGDVAVTNAGVSSLVLADGKIFIGDVAGAGAAQTLTGDVTVSNAGVTAIGATKVTKAMLATIIEPSHVVKFAGEFTTVGGDANEAIAVVGALATDVAIVTLKTKGGTPRTILTAAADTDVINVVMSDDPSNDHVLSYMIIRATA